MHTRKLLPTRKVCERYQVVSRTLDRWDQRPELEFPKPEYINGRKYRDEAALDEWDRRRAALSAGMPRGRRSGANQPAPAPEAA